MVDQKEFTEQEKEALVKFREVLTDILETGSRTDYDLVRWLRARGLDIPKAEKMFRDSLAWREKWGIDTIIEDYNPPEVLKKYYSSNFIGFSKRNYAVIVTRIGRNDMKGIMHSVKPDDVIRYVFWKLEGDLRIMRKRTEETGQPCRKTFVIQDCDEMSISQMFYKPALDISRKCLEMYEDNYPEQLGMMFTINAPRFFTIIYNVFSKFLAEETLRKIRIFGKDKEKWKEALLEEVDADVLPAIYGGNRTDPDGDPSCKTIVVPGGKVPKSYYMTSNKDKFKSKKKLKSASVGKGDQLRIPFDVDTVGSKLTWEFVTDNCDIGFGIEFEGADDEIEEILPIERVESHMVVQEGEWILRKQGKYTVIFDNSYSYLRSKQLSYNIKLHPPK